MEGNRDEAKRAYKLAQSYQTTDPTKALKFAKKACALYWSPEAAALVKTLETGEGPSSSSNGTGTSTATQTASTGTTSKRTTPKPSVSTPSNFKPAQLDLVKKVRRHKTTQYYEILELKRESDESQIKSAYRKLALALHPDKNNAPGADEAFKMVSKAFQVLSDPDKRAAYDRHGADPDSRSAGVPSSSPFGGGGGGGMRFTQEDAIDPDQLFRMFFGGGGFDHPGMQFGGGPTVFQFGGGGTTFRRNGFNRRPQQQQNHQNEPEVRTPSTWLSLLPIILFFGVSLFQSFPSLFSATPVPYPAFSWNPSSVYPVQRITQTSPGVTYFVNPTEFATHPMYEKYLKSNPILNTKTGTPKTTESSSSDNNPNKKEEEKLTSQESTEKTRELVLDLIDESRQLIEKRSKRQYLVVPKDLQKFEAQVEAAWVRKLQYECQNSRANRDARRRELIGFLGIGADWEAIKKLDSEVIPACEGLKSMGYVID
ncbi:hypothetical protein Pst134EA_016026 [Puccinia striiformis f. sp. tritici]|uniref:hypothetical protein n=1 Tax=Puccinia striiformis f. sp. tritici TaxID=168172 RepID=UPI002008DE4B|nr:hypothetical protein Pst134EA_016026 [Puccinia striiformis f. sp. tritici]KAH9463946.1 hypothetical protein Pst134EA_016026 [Puccinia striiformis f. sp. tritici]